MTEFEGLLLGQVKELTNQVTEIRITMGRLEERLEDLEKDDGSSYRPRSERTRPTSLKRDGGLVVSAGTVVLVVNALLAHFAAPSMPQPAPTHLEAPK
jgi:hypothetical protein